jgi:small subunit ribosomal protein S7
MRRKQKTKAPLPTDALYNSQKVTKLINYIMEAGKKNAARKIVYDSLIYIKEKAKVEDPIELFETAIRNIGPNMEVRSRRVGGANYQVPTEVRPERKLALSMRWIIEAARTKKGQPMHVKLGDELIAASKNEGEAFKKRENTHKMAEANKAFAHFAW